MSKSKPGKAAYRGNLTTFTKGIKGKVLENIEITNERECRTISLAFQDKTHLAITIHITMGGRLELYDTKTGDLELIRRVGRIPDEQWINPE